MNASPERTVQQWACDELERWPSFNGTAFADTVERLQGTYNVYVLDIANGSVRIRPKQHESAPLRIRASIYAHYITNVLRSHSITQPTVLLLDTEDEAVEHPGHAVFSFQRRVGSLNPLLPDLDTIATDFYLSNGPLPDQLPYLRKRAAAVFAGSTTGACPITASHLEVPFPRLSSTLANRLGRRGCEVTKRA